MAEVLTAQLDYVYFVYGLALILLGAVAVSISRDDGLPLPWGWLAAFGFAHGTLEWLHLLALSVGDTPSFRLARSVLLLASYLCLLEFARLAHRALRGTGPGPWITWLLGALAVAPALVGSQNLNPAARIVVGLTACVWTAFTLLAAARQPAAGSAGQGAALRWAALCLAGYGIASSFVVPDAPIVPRGWLTAEAFVASTSVPVQLIRALLVGNVAMGIWAYAVSHDAQGRIVRKRWRHFWSMAVTLLVVIAAGWIFTNELGRLHDDDVTADAESAAAQIQDHLFMEMESAVASVRTAARLVSRFDLVPAIAAGGSARLDDVVEAVGGSGGDQIAYLLDPRGTVVAASNRGEPGSFAGRSDADRPYFQEALQGRSWRVAGREPTGGRAGFYASEPLRDAGGKIAGVAVVMHLLTPESFGPLGTGTSFLVAPDGKVLVTGAEPFRGRDLWRSSSGGDDAAARGAPILDRAVTGTEWMTIGAERHVVLRKPLPGIDWSIVTWRKATLRGPNRSLGIVLTLLVTVVLVGSFVALQRQIGTESRLAARHREAEGRAREAARRADTDALTGVANRLGFNQAVAREFARAQRFQHPLSVMILDLDHFKRVNDDLGHAAGDEVLVGTARLLASRVRESDLVARWGGEEFAVIASVTDAAGAVRLAEKLRALLAATSLGPAGRVTASFGVAEMRAEDTVESLMQRADEALYQAKAGGRNQVRCAEAWVDTEAMAAGGAPGSLDPEGRPRATLTRTGFGPIDAEHETLDRGLEAFIREVDGGGVDATRTSLADFIEGIARHFANEEGLMRKHGYPARARHEEAHQHFVADARRFQADLEGNGVTPGFRRWAVTRLPEWFQHHILAHDIALAKFLAAGEAQATRLDPDPDPIGGRA